MEAIMGEEKNESGVVKRHDVNVDEMELDTPSNEYGKFEVSSVYYPTEIGAELEKAWPKVKSAIENYGVSCTLNLVEGSMTVFTTRKNTDPNRYRRVRMLIGFLANHVPPRVALSVLSKELETIDIGTGAGGLCSNIEITEVDRIFTTGSAEELMLARKIGEDCMLRHVCPKCLFRKRDSIKSMNQAIKDLGEFRF